MPLYVYTCPSCGHEQEVLRPTAQRDEPLSCEHCGSTESRRSGASFASAVQGASRGFGGSSACGGGGGFT